MGASNFKAKTDAAIEAVKGRSLPGIVSTLAFAGIGWGVVGFGYGLGTGKAPWTWASFLIALFWMIGVAQGGVVFAGIMQGTQARWGRPLKRIGESFGLYLPVLWLLMAVFLIGGLQIYPWYEGWWHGDPISLAPHNPQAPASKEILLAPGFFRIRLLVGAALLFSMSLVFVRNAMRPDLIAMRDKLGSAAPKVWWHDLMIGNATNAATAAEKGLAANYNLVPFLGFAYSLIFSMFSFDLIMSLDPWWFSNMFGGWLFMSSLLLGMCTIAVVSMLSKDWLSLGDFVTRSTTHDLGKLMLAGTMFWAYTLFAQILPIYYTDVPEETNFLLVRMVLPEWAWLARIVAVLCFIAPFTILLSRGIKKMRNPFMGVALVSMTGLFLERSLLVLPAVSLDGGAFPWLDFVVVNLGILAGLLGGFALVVGKALASMPAVPVTDPLLETHPWDVHVHSLDAHPAHH